MSAEEEGFLARWSRRKREGAEAEREPDTPQSPAAKGVDNTDPKEQEETPFDLSTLPSLESIDRDSDVRAFLAAGVPSQLTAAALRRAWATDPAIRDFIGLSENAWDFNAPAGVPGFGPLQMTEDIKRIADQILGNGEERTSTLSSVSSEDAEKVDRERQNASPPPSVGSSVPSNEEEKVEQSSNNRDAPVAVASGPAEHLQDDTASQHASPGREDSNSRRSGGHGGALPR